MTRSILKLNHLEPFAIGGTRRCYIHPDNPCLCVKVLREDRTPRERRRLVAGPKRFLPLQRFDDQWKEQRAYDELLSNLTDATWQHVPEYFGTVDTDLGLGIVSRVFRNHDGKFPQTLEDLLPIEGITDALRDAIQEFKQWLRTDLFLSRHLLPHNIIVVKLTDTSYRLVIVDGIGNSEMIPISSWFKFFARNKIERKIRYFDFRINELLK
ncbi:MAG: YrbL family protein [Gammaproteobacteria bacterium]|nr:YrbL family protein [Gammaproteobacteria bacterium]